jgi:plastocyanin
MKPCVAHACSLTAAVALAIPLLTGTARAVAATSISGTVKATGLASNADAVVYVEQAPGAFQPPAKPVDMDQRKMQFIPHVLPVVLGTTVNFLNSDPTAHNVFSPDHEKYNLGTWPQGQRKAHLFDKCPKPPCVYTQLCRVHPEMEGFVVVLQNPYFAVTDRDGHYTIADVPAGKYMAGVWHAKLKAASKPATLEAGKPVTVDFTLGR